MTSFPGPPSNVSPRTADDLVVAAPGVDDIVSAAAEELVPDTETADHIILAVPLSTSRAGVPTIVHRSPVEVSAFGIPVTRRPARPLRGAT